MLAPGPSFARFLLNASPGFNKFRDIEVLNPYSDAGIADITRAFCRKFYSSEGQRLLVLGINPGRKGGGCTGIPFTDPVALDLFCGIPNALKKERELSSTFIYEVVGAFGGPEIFYSKVLLSAVCPVGFVRQGKNFNYYDDEALYNKMQKYLHESLQFQSGLGVNRKCVISLGKENAAQIRKINEKLNFFEKVIELEHPRYIMQYKRKNLASYVKKYRDLILDLN